MASLPNTKTLSLFFLFSALLIFMHVHGSNARDMKVEQELPKQSEASSAFKEDDSYAGYNALYSTKKHIQQKEDDSYARYNALYNTKDSYASTYGKDSKDSYAVTYRKHSKDSYGATYEKDSKDYYAATYGKNSKDFYATTYGKDSNDSYAVTYGKDSKDSYVATYGKDSKDSYEAATYGKDSKYSYAAATNGKESKDSYAATYGKEFKGSYINSYGKNKLDHTEAFKTGFFTLDDLYVGNMMTLKFPSIHFPNFVTKKEASSIPFSTSQLPKILQLFSINEDSPQAQAMRDTLDQCEFEPLTGETKTCVSSLESMTDFVRSIIDPEAQLNILKTILPTPSSIPLQNFTILEISQDIYAPKWVACHPLQYPYAVFYCHFIGTGSKIFKVQLGSKNGVQVSAMGICHLDTSEWSPGLILFKQLGIKPGDAPVCHFFPVNHLMWVPLP